MRVYIELDENIDNISELHAYIRTRDDKYIRVGGDIKLWATEKQKTGQWIWIESIGAWKFMCSVCKESVDPMPTCMGKPLMRYCPACGSLMQEESEYEE